MTIGSVVWNYHWGYRESNKHQSKTQTRQSKLTSNYQNLKNQNNQLPQVRESDWARGGAIRSIGIVISSDFDRVSYFARRSDLSDFTPYPLP